MNLPLAYHPNVEEDIKDAYRWHEEQRASLGQEFLDAIEEVFDSLLHSPRRHGIVYQENVRRALPRRFPYAVLYRVLSDRVEILAVYHSHRDPIGWQARV
jgi:plasmid stabilization system protein ParE